MLRGYFKYIVRLFYFFILAIMMLTLAGCAFQKFNQKYGTPFTTNQQYQTFIEKLNSKYPQYQFIDDNYWNEDIPENLPQDIVEDILKDMGLKLNPPPSPPLDDIISIERTSRNVNRSQRITNERGVIVTGAPSGL